MKIDERLTAIITGGASGLGFAAAKALRGQGTKVTIFDFNPEAGEKAADEIGALFCEVDVTSDASLDAGFAKSRAAYGQERALIACAGGGLPFPTIAQDADGQYQAGSSAAFAKVLQLNVVGSFATAARFAAGLAACDPIDGERGVALFTSSVAADDGQEHQAAYAAAKAAIKGMTLSIARDLGRHAIRVNSIQPGPYATPALSLAPPEMIDDLVDQLIFPKRLGNPQEFASAAMEMIRNPFFNATSVRVDGGIRLPNWIG